MASPQTPSTARITFRRPLSSVGFIDGAWWPTSRDLERELPDLIRAMSDEGIDIRRVAYNRTWWQPAPNRLHVGGQVIRLGGFEHQDELLIGLVDESRTFRRDFLVIDPKTDSAQAEVALKLAAESGCTDRPAALMDEARRQSGRTLHAVRSN